MIRWLNNKLFLKIFQLNGKKKNMKNMLLLKRAKKCKIMLNMKHETIKHTFKVISS